MVAVVAVPTTLPPGTCQRMRWCIVMASSSGHHLPGSVAHARSMSRTFPSINRRVCSSSDHGLTIKHRLYEISDRVGNYSEGWEMEMTSCTMQVCYTNVQNY